MHMLVVAPTGSKKSTSVAIPTALTWQHSLFLHDPKCELRALSAGWRSTFSRIAYVNPTDETSDCYDPLAAIRLDTPADVRDATIVSDILVNPDGEQPHSDAARHFQGLASAFVRGVLLHGLYTQQATTLPKLADFFFSEASLEAVLREMEHAPHTSAGTHPAVLRAVYLTKRLADRELSGLCSTVAGALEMTLDPLVARILSRSDFTLADLRERPHPMTLYLSVPYTDQERLWPFSRLITRQVLDWNTQHLGGWRYRLLMLIDEVQALRYMPALSEGLNFVRGYQINLLLITPSMNDLDRIYGPKHNFVEESHLRVVFAPNDPQVAEHFSQMTGLEEATDGQTTWEQRLLSSTGLTYLSPEQGLLLIGNGGYPAIITKAPYYTSWRLRRRAQYVA
jgi:type IV secretion system protein VirD4